MNSQDVKNINVNQRAVSCCINFIRELLKEDDGEELAIEILEKYFDSLTKSVAFLFSKGVELQNLELLSEVLSFISIFSNVMKE